jgi:YVTN family beta-propeller protein
MPHGRIVVALVLLAVAAGMGALRRSPDDLVVRTVPVGSAPMAPAIAPHAGRVFVGNQGNNSVSVLDAASGRVLRTTFIRGMPWALIVAEQVGRVFVTDAADDNVHVLDARSGALLNTVAIRPAVSDEGRDILARVVDAGSRHVLVVSKSGVLLLNASSGRVPYRVSVGAAAVTRGAVLVERAGRLVVVTESAPGAGVTDRVSLLDAHTGALMRTVPVGTGANALAVDERTERVFVTVSGPLSTLPDGYPGNPIGLGTVRVLDARNGTLVHTTTVGLLPYAVAIDERKAHAFVVNAGCPAPELPCGVRLLTRLTGPSRHVNI